MGREGSLVIEVSQKQVICDDSVVLYTLGNKRFKEEEVSTPSVVLQQTTERTDEKLNDED